MFKIFNKDKNNEIDNKNDDIQICLDKDNKPVMVSVNKNRLANMLFVGPTGCNKTHFSFMNMMYQDMQNPNCGVTLMEPTGFLSLKTYAMAKLLNRNITFFNVNLNQDICPKFNPMIGHEYFVIYSLVYSFKQLNKDLDEPILSLNEKLLTYSITILKRLYGDNLSLKELYDLIENVDNYGLKIVELFSNLNNTEKDTKDLEIIDWMRNEYFIENPKNYNDCKNIREQLYKFITNDFLKNNLVLSTNNYENEKTLNIDKCFENNDVLIITPRVPNAPDMTQLLSLLLMMHLNQSVSDRRHRCKRPLPLNSLYINELPFMQTPDFIDCLTIPHSNNMAINVGIQSIDTIPKRCYPKANSEEDFLEYRNYFLQLFRTIIIYPGISETDANYFSKIFNEQSKNEHFNAFDMINKPFNKIDYRLYSHGEIIYSKGTVSHLPEDALNKIEQMEEQCYNLLFK